MFKKNLIPWVEEYLFFPTPLQQLISALLLPLTLLYCLIVSTKRILAKKKYFGIPVIGIGNLLVGGTGKTPVTIALAKDKKNVAVVLRGYGRQSKGLIAVSNKGKILTNVQQSGDEAMLLALSLPNAIVIVSQKREEGIVKAKELGAKLVFLDDGFSQYGIEKYDILVRPQEEPSNIFCLPSGGYREPKIMYGIANQVLLEGKDFNR
ncbi:MAG: tetraacyldisaccharide 4'-kinase, partial [Campylobacterota bacterium]|nr:tetraacyldisaccharide 4'-kinase [Campylobacterota bacterium]